MVGNLQNTIKTDQDMMLTTERCQMSSNFTENVLELSPAWQQYKIYINC